MAQQEEDWSKYEVKQPEAPQTEDWSQYEVPKKALPPASKNGSGISAGGSKSYPNSLTSFSQPINQSLDYAPLTTPARQVQLEKDTEIRQAQQVEKQRISNQLKNIYKGLSPEAKGKWDKAVEITAYSQAHPDKLSEPTEEEVKHDQFMQTVPGKILGTVAYLGSKATKGTLQIAKGAAWLADNTVGAGSDKRVVDEVNKLDQYSDVGLNKRDIASIEDGKGGHLLQAVGGVTEFLPAIYTGGITNKAATFALQGFGQMNEVVDRAEKSSGTKLKPWVRNTLIAGGGAVNAVLMGDVASIFGKLPAGLRGDITARITADALKEAAGKELTGEAFRGLLEAGAKTWEDKVARFGLDAVKGTAKAAIDLSALNTSQFVLKKAADEQNGTPVFNENLGDLAQSVSDVVIKQAPLFGLAGVAGDIGKLTPYSSYKNAAVESLMADPSEANVAKIHEQLADYGTKNGWTPEETQATNEQVSEIASIAKRLPRDIKSNKLVEAVDLIKGRDELLARRNAVTEAKNGIDEAVRDIPTREEALLDAKIEQANDKLQGIVGGARLTYGFDKETGKYYKNIDGKPTEITKERYDLERLERDARQQLNQDTEVLVESPSTEVPSETTTLRNADVEAKRKEYGFDEPAERTVKPNEELVKEADAEIAKGYDAHELMDKVINDKHVPTDVESVVIAKFQGAKESQLIDVNDRIEKESATANPDAFERLVKERDAVLDDLQRSYNASEAGGTAAGRALQARKVAIVRDYSLANLLIRKRSANGGNPLTQEQINETTAKYNDLKTKTDAYEAKIKELESKNESLLSEQATARLKKLQERTVKRQTKVEDLDKDIEASKTALKKIVRKSLGNLSANPLPLEFAVELGNLVKLYAQKGIVNLTEVVDNIYNDFKNDIDGLERADILEAIGNIPEENNASKDPLGAVKSRMQRSTRDVEERTANRDFSKKPRVKIKLDEEGLRLRDALEEARRNYEIESYKEQLRNRTPGKKWLDRATEVINTPRALLASTDFSAPLRQGLVLSVSHPIKAAQAFAHMFKVAWSENTFDRWFYDLKEAPDYEKMKESKLYISDPNAPELAAREEDFMNNLAEKIPFLGRSIKIPYTDRRIGGLVKGSERAYVGYLNKLRVDIFRQASELFEQDGLTMENSPETYKGLAKWINNATGRGDFKNENLAQSLNLVMFSPRLMAARINLLNILWYKKLPPPVKKMAIADMGKMLALGTTVLALAKLNGLQTEADPRSSDFGKIRSGKRRWDIWGGFSQYVRFIAQELSGETKSTTTGKISKLGGKKFGARTRAGVAVTFFRNKLAPIPAVMVNALDEKDAMGKPFKAEDAFWRNVVPLTLQDTWEAFRDEGMSGAFKVGLPTTFGVGVQTYDSKGKK